MRNPKNVLFSLSKHSKFLDYKFNRLYRILFNPELFYKAYRSIYANYGNMTIESELQHIDAKKVTRIEKLIGAIRNESYQPNHPIRTDKLKKSDKQSSRTKSFDDNVVQEVIKLILVAIYEGSFEENSHGFRPRRNCHTAMRQVSRTFYDTKWFIQGNINDFYVSNNHEVLMGILGERIGDERFLRLIRKFLNAGCLDHWVFNRTYSGTPQGGILSPILMDIYLDKLDKFMNGYIQRFNNDSRRSNRLSKVLESQKVASVQLHPIKEIVEESKLFEERINLIDRKKAMLQECSVKDESPKDLKYVRYADGFLIGVSGSLVDCEQIKEDVSNFLNDKLKLVLSKQEMKITHTRNSIKFLSFEVSVRKSNFSKIETNGELKRPIVKKIVIKIPKGTIKNKLLACQALDIRLHNGKEQWKSKSRIGLVNNGDLEILRKFNSEIIGFYNYYSIAINSATTNTFGHILEYSMYKTFANKYRTTVWKICKKYKKNGVFCVSYMNNKRKTCFLTFYKKGFARKIDLNVNGASVDKIANYNQRSMQIRPMQRGGGLERQLIRKTNELELPMACELKDIRGYKSIVKSTLLPD